MKLKYFYVSTLILLVRLRNASSESREMQLVKVQDQYSLYFVETSRKQETKILPRESRDRTTFFRASRVCTLLWRGLVGGVESTDFILPGTQRL
jgi:hypothetical protein